MMGRVTPIKDLRLEENFPREWPARVRMELEDGRQLEQSVRFPKGDPQNPLTAGEMAAKFRSLAGAVLPAARCDEIIAMVPNAHPAALPGLCVPAASACLGANLK